MRSSAEQSPDRTHRVDQIPRITQTGDSSGRLRRDAAPEAAGAQDAPVLDNAPRELEGDETRDALLAVISHELKSPTTTLSLSAQLLGQQLRDQGELDRARAVRLIEKIERQSTKLAELVKYLLAVSHSGPDSVPLKREETNLVALAGDVVHDAQARTARHEIRLAAPAPVRAMIDRARIEQVLVNLLDNAVKYSPAGGEIEVALAQRDEDVVSIAVRDHGVGVPLEHREHMFDRFSEAHDHRLPGLGLGLFLSSRLVERHGGKLTAEFPADGGTRMVLRLPAS